jgi:hypothetical protein
VVPITPARPKAPKPKAQPAKSKPKTPAAPFTFASCQIEASRNKRSAAVLFTPYKHHAGVGHSVNEPQPSPTLQPAARLATRPAQNVVPQLGSEDLSDDDVEEQLQEGLHRLNFGSGSDSQFHAGSHSHSGSQSSLSSQSSSSSQSRSISPSHSGPQAPRAGPHSKLKKAAVKPRAGAKDVWTFFTEVKRRHVCVLCQ